VGFLDAVRARVWLADGAMGTRLFAKGIAPGRCLEELNLSLPALVREIHNEYRAAGAEILTTNTFGANAARLAAHGLEDFCYAINTAGVRLAREAAGAEGWVAGSVGPLGVNTLCNAREIFLAQIEALADAGADMIMLETFRDLKEIHEAILAAREACDLPLIALVSPDDEGRLADGSAPELYAIQLADWGADVIGGNCGTGPQSIVASIQRMAAAATASLAAEPSAGLPIRREGADCYPCSPQDLAQITIDLVHNGVRILGGCCGTTPEHIRAMREAIASVAAGRWARST